MKNKNQAVFGLFYDHSFKKIILTIGIYIIASILLAFYMFNTSSLMGTIYMSDFMLNTYFEHFSRIAFFFIFYFTTKGSGIILSKDLYITNRITISKQKIQFITFIYFIFIMLISYAAIIISQYAIINLHLFYYDYAFYNKLHIFGTIINNNFFYQVLPFYNLNHYIVKLGILMIVELAAIGFQSESRASFLLDVFFASFIAFLFM